MKNRSVIIGAEATLLLLAVLVSVFLNAIRSEAVSRELYDRFSREAVAEMHGGDPVRDTDMVSAYIGLDETAQHRFAETLSTYMRGDSDLLPEELNEKERIHMADVRRLVRLAERVSRLMLGLCTLLVISMAWFSRDPGVHPLRSAGIGFVIGAGIAAGLAGYAMMNFISAFVWMHTNLFKNDFWMMDPRTDILIRVMPSELFVHATQRCLIQSLQQGAIIAILLTLLYIFMRRLIKRWVKEPVHG